MAVAHLFNGDLNGGGRIAAIGVRTDGLAELLVAPPRVVGLRVEDLGELLDVRQVDQHVALVAMSVSCGTALFCVSSALIFVASAMSFSAAFFGQRDC